MEYKPHVLLGAIGGENARWSNDLIHWTDVREDGGHGR